jgi:hypothetical protein
MLYVVDRVALGQIFIQVLVSPLVLDAYISPQERRIGLFMAAI